MRGESDVSPSPWPTYVFARTTLDPLGPSVQQYTDHWRPAPVERANPATRSKKASICAHFAQARLFDIEEVAT